MRRVRPGHLVFDPGPLIAAIDPAARDAVLEATRGLSLNAAEAPVLTGESSPTAAAVALQRILDVDGPKTPPGLEFSARQPGSATELGPGGVVVRPGGDAHVGGLVAALAWELGAVEACRWANAAAAVVVASRGQVSPPTLSELRAILALTGP